MDRSYHLQSIALGVALVGGAMHAGSHRVAWDGRNDLGRPTDSGIYFARLVADGHRAAQRLVLQRLVLLK